MRPLPEYGSDPSPLEPRRDVCSRDRGCSAPCPDHTPHHPRLDPLSRPLTSYPGTPLVHPRRCPTRLSALPHILFFFEVLPRVRSPDRRDPEVRTRPLSTPFLPDHIWSSHRHVYTSACTGDERVHLCVPSHRDLHRGLRSGDRQPTCRGVGKCHTHVEATSRSVSLRRSETSSVSTPSVLRLGHPRGTLHTTRTPGLESVPTSPSGATRKVFFPEYLQSLS